MVADDRTACDRLSAAYRCRMTGRGRRGVLAWLAPALVVAVAGIAGALHLAGRGALSVQQCVPGTGVGRLGLGLALLRVDEVCPRGTLAVGGDQRQVIGVVVVVALPVLAAHLAGATLGVGLLARLHGLLRVLVAALGSLGLHLPTGAPLVSAVREQVDVAVEAPTSRVVVGVPQRRGPPRVSFA